MSDWTPGDLAVCVDASPCKCGNCGGARTYLEEGRIYKVLAIIPAFQIGVPSHRWTNLEVGARASDGHRPNNGHCSDRFRKIRPDEHEACESEFVTLLQRIKRKEAA